VNCLPGSARRAQAAAILAGGTVAAVLAATLAAPARVLPAGLNLLTASNGVTVTLTSAGTDGTAGAQPSGNASVAADGRYVAFQSDSALNVTPPTSLDPGVSRIYVRDLIGHSTTLASGIGPGDAVAPDISADGTIVSYEQGSGGADNVYVAVRQAAAPGAAGTPGGFRAEQVTGTAGSLSDERVPACPAAAVAQTAPCGPKLSADGTTLVYPATQTPASPALSATVDGRSLPGNLLDFVPSESDGGSAPDLSETVTYTVTGLSPVTFDSPAVTATPPFSVQSTPANSWASTPATTGTPCAGTLQPGQSCQVTVAFTQSACGWPGSPVLVTGSLTTDATTPAGQSSLELAAFCSASFSSSSAFYPAGPARASPASATAWQCPGPPAGVPYSRAPASTTDNQGTPLTSLGNIEVGRPRVVWATVTAPAASNAADTFSFSSSGCGIQLTNPGSRAVAGQPSPCVSGEALGGTASPASCTAYFLIDPTSVATSAAVLTVSCDFAPSDIAYIAASGIRSLVIARHDPTGRGDFAASPETVVSVDGSGSEIPGAGQPSVSATGRYVAFTAPVPYGQPGAQPADGTEVWRHDTDAAGNRSYRPGGTILVSCQPGADTCQPAASAASPSLSGDGQTVAFTAGRQVEVRDITADRTVIASAGPTGTPGNGLSFAPALSQDASTVAYVSEATNLAGGTPARPPGVPSLYVRQLTPQPGGNELIEPAGPAAPGTSGAGLPAIDAHGRLVSFQTADRIVSAAAPGVQNVYTAERLPRMSATPSSISFGKTLPRGRTQTATVSIQNAGPGPATVTGVRTTGPFVLTAQDCQGVVLHAGATCTVTVSFTPAQPGPAAGRLLVSTADDGEPPVALTISANATVATPTLALSPPVDLPGQVTQVTGTGFPADAAVTLTWSPGLGTATAQADTTGRFSAAMLIFPDDVTGPRTLIAKSASGEVLATAPFLVGQPPAEPPFNSPSGAPPTSSP
jgi:hypothetical protein